jgi:hypothetical protein
MDVAETESRLPADGALSSCNRISITGTYFASFLVRPNLRPNKRMIVKGKFPLGLLTNRKNRTTGENGH